MNCRFDAKPPAEICARDLLIRLGNREIICRAALGPVTFGRDFGRANIHIDHPRVSRMHIRVAPSGRGWQLADLDSLNGTFVRDQRITTIAFTETLVVRLAHRDGVTLTFQCLPKTRCATPPRPAIGRQQQPARAVIRDKARRLVDDTSTAHDKGKHTDALTSEDRVAVLCDALIIALKTIADRAASVNPTRESRNQLTTLIRELQEIEALVRAAAARYATGHAVRVL